VRAAVSSFTPKTVSTFDKEEYLAEDAKVFKTDDGFYQLKEDQVKGINPFEKTKLAKDAIRSLKYSDEFQKMCKTDFKDLDDADAAQIDTRLKYVGLFHRRKATYGRFMMRVRLPNGVVTAEQMRYMGELTASYGEDGCADITTRQNLQLRGILLSDAPEIFRRLSELGITTTQSGMDNVRNVVGSPLAGIDPQEIVDTRPFALDVDNFLTKMGQGNKEVCNLPRKFNVAIVGTHDLYEHPHINDLAFVPATHDGVDGFNVEVGGFFSAVRCAEAIPLGCWVPYDHVTPLVRAVLTAFRDYGARKNRQKTRVMYLVEEMGVEEFKNEIASRMGVDLKGEGKSSVDPKWVRRSYYGVNKQVDGDNFVGLNVPVGRLQADDMLALAHLAETYGSGEIRLTVEQNAILIGVPDSKVEDLMSQPLLTKFSPSPTPMIASTVACTGNQFCGFAMIETKASAKAMSEHLDSVLNIPEGGVRMHWTGCPNTCAQVQVADIGFLGSSAKGPDGKKAPAVDIFIGGAIGHESELANCVKKGVLLTDLRPIVEQLMIDEFGATRKD